MRNSACSDFSLFARQSVQLACALGTQPGNLSEAIVGQADVFLKI